MEYEIGKCELILIEFESGKTLKAEGDAADELWRWYEACELMNRIHGAKFRGKGFTVLNDPNEPVIIDPSPPHKGLTVDDFLKNR